MQPVPPPICVGRVALFSTVWREFDRGLYLFIKEEVYKPICTPTFSIRRKLVAGLLVFMVVLFWHEATLSIGTWILMNIGVLLARGTALYLYQNNTRIARTFDSLSPHNQRRLLVLLQLPLLLLSFVALHFFYHMDMAKWSDWTPYLLTIHDYGLHPGITTIGYSVCFYAYINIRAKLIHLKSNRREQKKKASGRKNRVEKKRSGERKMKLWKLAILFLLAGLTTSSPINHTTLNHHHPNNTQSNDSPAFPARVPRAASANLICNVGSVTNAFPEKSDSGCVACGLNMSSQALCVQEEGKSVCDKDTYLCCKDGDRCSLTMDIPWLRCLKGNHASGADEDYTQYCNKCGRNFTGEDMLCIRDADAAKCKDKVTCCDDKNFCEPVPPTTTPSTTTLKSGASRVIATAVVFPTILFSIIIPVSVLTHFL